MQRKVLRRNVDSARVLSELSSGARFGGVRAWEVPPVRRGAGGLWRDSAGLSLDVLRGDSWQEDAVT